MDLVQILPLLIWFGCGVSAVIVMTLFNLYHKGRVLPSGVHWDLTIWLGPVSLLLAFVVCFQLHRELKTLGEKDA